MPLSAEQRTDRARNAAYARHHPGADPQDLERARIDEHIAAILDAGRKGALSPEQESVLSRTFRYGRTPESSAAR